MQLILLTYGLSIDNNKNNLPGIIMLSSNQLVMVQCVLSQIRNLVYSREN